MGANDKVAATYHPLTERQARYILARAGWVCAYEGCTNQATHIRLAYTPEELQAQHRDVNSPDNWQAVCGDHV